MVLAIRRYARFTASGQPDAADRRRVPRTHRRVCSPQIRGQARQGVRKGAKRFFFLFFFLFFLSFLPLCPPPACLLLDSATGTVRCTVAASSCAYHTCVLTTGIALPPNACAPQSMFNKADSKPLYKVRQLDKKIEPFLTHFPLYNPTRPTSCLRSSHADWCLQSDDMANFPR